MSADTGALDVKCPRCKARRGNPCVYTAPAAQFPSNQWMTDRAGAPMRTLHQERYRAVYSVRRGRRLREEIGAPYPGKARIALRQFDQQEHDRMVKWLRANADLFWEVARGS